MFYFTHAITRDLLNFHAKHFSEILSQQIEIDAYRDFLQPLGSAPLSLANYLEAIKPTAWHPIFTDLYTLFKGRSTLIMALRDSDFFHLGTMSELLDLYLSATSPLAESFRRALGFTRLKSSKLPTDNAHNIAGCVLSSRLGKNTTTNEQSLLECCVTDDVTRIRVGQMCYLSNCMILNEEAAMLEIPDNVCMHTMPIKAAVGGEFAYVTVFFDRRDDLKKAYSSLDKCHFLGKCIPNKLVRVLQDRIGPGASSNNCSIWSLKIFYAFSTMSESFRRSLEFVHRYLNKDEVDFESDRLTESFSLFDLLKCACFEKMLSYRLENQLI